MKYIHKIFIVLIIILLACKEEIILDSSKTDKILVVDGFISNESGPYTIYLSYSAPVELPEYLKCTGAKVSILDNKGYTEELTEIDPGVYQTSASGIQGIVGNEYKLKVNTIDGKYYETEFQELLNPIEIDTVYAVLDSVLDLRYPLGVLPGYQFYVSTETAPEHDNYLLWTMTETYKYKVDWDFGYIETRLGDIFYYYARMDSISICFKTDDVNLLYTGNTVRLNSPEIKDQPLIFVGTDTKKLSIRYSLLVKQFTLNEKAYNYWKEIEAQLSDENFLTTTQAFNAKSNLFNINENNELVLGYFTVGSVIKKRIFVDKPNVDFYFTKYPVMSDPEVEAEYRRLHPGIDYYYIEMEEGVYALIEDKSCLDCRNEGGVLETPEFWIDNQ